MIVRAARLWPGRRLIADRVALQECPPGPLRLKDSVLSERKHSTKVLTFQLNHLIVSTMQQGHSTCTGVAYVI